MAKLIQFPRADYNAVLRDICAEYSPSGPVEEALVQMMARERYRSLEQPGAERGFRRALKSLLDFRKSRSTPLKPANPNRSSPSAARRPARPK